MDRRPNHARVAQWVSAGRLGCLALFLATGALVAVAASALAATLPKSAATGKAGKFFFHDGDSPIVFLGDSITEQRMYTTYIETYVLTRFPKWTVTFRNIGWGGDTMGLTQRRGFETGVRRDILPLHPKAITIDFGMNDARGGDGNYARYINYATQFARGLKESGVRVALIAPSPEERYEAGQPAGSAFNKMLAKYSQGLQDVAAKEGVPFVDQFTPFVRVIEDGRKAGVLGAAGDPRLVPDGVHPNWAGHLVMAAAILKGLGAPALVSHMEIDAAVAKVKAAQGCTAEILPGAGDGVLAFRRADDSLPWPIPPEAALVLTVPGFTPLEDLSLYDLKVTGLKAEKYDLAIDDQVVGTFTKEALARGVNLTSAAGPITAQGAQLLQAVIDKNNLFFDRWRKTLVPNLPASLKEADVPADVKEKLAQEDRAIAEKEKQINALRVPAPHVFKLTPRP
jgi:lysophospholipase L1-like esterase